MHLTCILCYIEMKQAFYTTSRTHVHSLLLRLRNCYNHLHKVTTMNGMKFWCLYYNIEGKIIHHFLWVHFKIIYRFGNFIILCIQHWKKKWSYTIPWFKAHKDFATFTWWQCTDCNYLYVESSNESCWTITEYPLLCNPCKGSHQQCTSKHGIISYYGNSTGPHNL